jgi:hypothetical protein
MLTAQVFKYSLKETAITKLQIEWCIAQFFKFCLRMSIRIYNGSIFYRNQKDI